MTTQEIYLEKQLRREQVAYAELLEQTKIMGELIQALKEAVAEKDNAIEDLHQILAARNEEINQLRNIAA